LCRRGLLRYHRKNHITKKKNRTATTTAEDMPEGTAFVILIYSVAPSWLRLNAPRKKKKKKKKKKMMMMMNIHRAPERKIIKHPTSSAHDNDVQEASEDARR
jgi:hypothetical protein